MENRAEQRSVFKIFGVELKNVKLDMYHHIKVTTLVVLQMIYKKGTLFTSEFERILYFLTSTYLLKNQVVWTKSPLCIYPVYYVFILHHKPLLKVELATKNVLNLWHP